jgi:hypothetical protein
MALEQHITDEVCPRCGGKVFEEADIVIGHECSYVKFLCPYCEIDGGEWLNEDFALNVFLEKANKIPVFCTGCANNRKIDFNCLPCSACMIKLHVPAKEAMKFEMDKPSILLETPTMYSSDYSKIIV